MDSLKKNSYFDFLAKGSDDIPTFSSQRKTFSILNLIDMNIIDTTWLYPKEFFCQISNDLEEMNELLYALFLFKIMKLLKLGMIIEIYINHTKHEDENEDEDADISIINEIECKKYYGILIPLSEYLGFIRVLNDDATATIQSYIRSSKRSRMADKESFLSNLTEEVRSFKN